MGCCDELRFQSARQIWVWLNMSITEMDKATPYVFQSARQIWVWLNDKNTPVAYGFIIVSICQADLGLAELRHVRCNGCIVDSFQSARQIWVWLNVIEQRIELLARWFQSARQIWVWLNRARCLAMASTSGGFNLPGRFGFG